MRNFTVSRFEKATKANPSGKVEITNLSADLFETDGGDRANEDGYSVARRHSGVAFFNVEKPFWGDATRSLVAFFPGTGWAVEEK